VKRPAQGPYLLGEGLDFPPVHLADEHGLLAIGGDLSVERLLAAYRSGIFPWPWYDGMPMFWWAPDPRFVLHPDDLRVSRSLRKRIDSGATAPRPGQDGTWITEELVDGFYDLHEAGYAHSVEAWEDGRLVGGLYGVAIGGLFCGESMYTTRPDASKVAFVHVVRRLAARGFRLIDCQLETDHLSRFGACDISRDAYMDELARCLEMEDVVGSWDDDD